MMIALASKLSDSSLRVPHDPAEEARTITRFENDFWSSLQTENKCFAIPTEWWNDWSSYTGLEVLDRQTARVKVSSTLHPHEMTT